MFSVRHYLVRDEGWRDNVLYPIPKDCVFNRANRNTLNLIYNAWSSKAIHSQAGFSYLNVFAGNNSIDEAEGYIASLDSYIDEQTGMGLGVTYTLDQLLDTEYRIGIGLNDTTRAAQESMIYRVEQSRLESREGDKLNLVIDCNLEEIGTESLELPLVCRLGSEGKTVRLQKYNKEIKFPEPNIEKDFFKLLFLSPSIFKKGWLPESFEQGEDGKFRGKWHGFTLELVSAFVGKPKHIGGFDMKLRQPKPMYKAVPEGSVYYFKIIEGDKKQIVSSFHNKKISDLLAEQGFGHALVCSLNKLPNYE